MTLLGALVVLHLRCRNFGLTFD